MLWKLFKSTFMISLCTFGGGYVIVPMMQKKFVEDLNWVEEKEMLDMVAIAQTAPGAIAINTAVMLGYKLFGIIGALVAVIATVLPPMVILMCLYPFYTLFQNNELVHSALNGMQIAVAAIIIDAVFYLVSGMRKQKKYAVWLICIVTFIVNSIIQLPIWLLMLSMTCIGIILIIIENYYMKQVKHK